MPSTIIVTDGGGSGGSTGSGNWSGILKDLLPIALVIGAAWLLWPTISALLSSLTAGTGGGSTSSGFGTGTSTSGGTSQGTGTSIVSAIQKAISTPGTYINAGVSNVPQTGSGISNLFVNTGPGTPADLFPLGDVISTSVPVSSLSTADQQQILTNLANQPYLGWWSTPAQNAAAAQTNPGGVNSGGSSQSNIPAGQNHCPCTAALKLSGVCGQNDDWYVC